MDTVFVRGMQAETVIGVYGLEAASTEDADRREQLAREVWAVNASVDRARVHRGGNVIAVVWCAELTPACWEDVNAAIAARLGSP